MTAFFFFQIQVEKEAITFNKTYMFLITVLAKSFFPLSLKITFYSFFFFKVKHFMLNLPFLSVGLLFVMTPLPP